MEIQSPSERKKCRANNRRNALKVEVKLSQARVADDRIPGYLEIIAIAETGDFKDWFYDVNGFHLGKMLYEEPEETIEYIQRTYEREIERNQQKPDKRVDAIQYFKVRKERIRQATPAWYDPKEYKKLVILRREMNERHPCNAPYHIDHVIPIAGFSVSGLHVHTNMRVITGMENIIKSNKFEI